VCVRVQQNILNAENKIDKIFVDEVETLWREKPLRGSQTQEFHYPKTKQITKHSYSQTHCSSHTFNYNKKHIVNTSQPSLLLEGVFDVSFTLGPAPKIDFTLTIEHTLATAWELADLQFSLNTLFKHYGIQY
jgi:hypothetical protein